MQYAGPGLARAASYSYQMSSYGLISKGQLIDPFAKCELPQV
jgi:hypothetical protein